MSFFGFVKPKVQKLKEKGDVKSIIALLNYPKDHKVEQEAIEALGAMGKPALQPLLDILQSSDAHVAINVIFALSRMRDPNAIATLEDYAKSHLMINGYWPDRRIVIALKNCGWKPQKDDFGVRCMIVEGDFNLCSGAGGVAIAPLIKSLEDKKIIASMGSVLNENVAYNRAIGALLEINDKRVIPYLENLLIENLLINESKRAPEILKALRNLGWQDRNSVMKEMWKKYRQEDELSKENWLFLTDATLQSRWEQLKKFLYFKVKCLTNNGEFIDISAPEAKEKYLSGTVIGKDKCYYCQRMSVMSAEGQYWEYHHESGKLTAIYHLENVCIFCGHHTTWYEFGD